jgi:15-cis-phytoene synthase
MTDAAADDAPDDDLDALVRRVDPDRWLSSRFIADPAARADVIALYAFDHELARAPRVASNPILAEIRLTWWREALDEVFADRPVRRHPTARAVAAAVRRHGLPRAPLETMIDARVRELDGAGDALQWAGDTGGAAAVLAAMILDPKGPADAARSAGAAWALSRREGAERETVRQALAAARTHAQRLGVAAFPAVAHAALAGDRRASGLAKRLRLTWAVARGRL